jgi:DNA-binding response OmpR family regulator
MNLVGACVLLVADDLGTLERMQRYLARAGAHTQAASRARGLSATASRCDVVVLFDDYQERNEFDACCAMLSESKVPLLIVSDRPYREASAPGAGLLVASARSVAPSSFLDALRARVSTATTPEVVDSMPELPFTD